MISVVIPALNEEKYIGKCLRSLERQNYSDSYEVIVMDNGSDDRTRDIAKDHCDRLYKEPELKLHQLRNKGIKIADGDKIALIDSDCVAYSNWLKEAEKGLKRSDLVIGSITPLENSSFYRFAFWIFSDVFLKHSINHFGFSNALGGNCAFYRDKALEIGGFKESFPSDANFGLEMKKAGKLYQNSDMKVKTSARRYMEGSPLEIIHEMTVSHVRLRKGSSKSVAESDYFDISVKDDEEV